jgi:rhodanese-related sulfurtransferase
MEHISIEDFHQVIQDKGTDNVNVVDVRAPEKFEEAHIEGAINLPLSELEDHLDVLDKDKHYYVICQAERFSRRGTEILNDHGFEATNVTSGMNDYPGETVSSN